jgi:hypothetical protein
MKNSGDREEINSRFSTSFHMKEISAMYLNIFNIFHGAKARLLIAAITFPTPTTKHATIVRIFFTFFHINFAKIYDPQKNCKTIHLAPGGRRQGPTSVPHGGRMRAGL